MKSYKFKSPFDGSVSELGLVWEKFSNGQKRLLLIDMEDGSPYAKASTTVDDVIQAPDEIFIKTWSENKGVLEFLVENGIVAEPHAFLPTGHAAVSVCKITL